MTLRNIGVSILITLCLARPATPAARAASEPLLLVVGLAFPVTDVSLTDVKSVFRGRVVTLGGRRLIPINHPPGTGMREAFDLTVLGLRPAEVSRFWVDQRIRDAGRPPTSVPTPEMAIRVAATLPGAITYGSKDMLNPKVKILTVDGKLPGTAGYPLQ